MRMSFLPGSRVRSTLPFNFGLFMADVKCPSGLTSGLVSAFYVSRFILLRSPVRPCTACLHPSDGAAVSLLVPTFASSISLLGCSESHWCQVSDMHGLSTQLNAVSASARSSSCVWRDRHCVREVAQVPSFTA